jgi:hypothetical protein
MTFFANAGVKWPNLEVQLREAGGIALDGAAGFWLCFLWLKAGHPRKAVVKKK